MPTTTRTLPLRAAKASSTDSIPGTPDANRSVSIPATGRINIAIRITKSYPGSLPQPKSQGVAVCAGDLTNQTNTEHAGGAELTETVQASMPRDCSLADQGARNETKSARESQCHRCGNFYSVERNTNGLSGVPEDNKRQGTWGKMAPTEWRRSSMNAQGEFLQEVFHDRRQCEHSMIEEATRNFGPEGALRDYKRQLMLLEQQNKKRLMMARAEWESKEKEDDDDDDNEWHDPTMHELASLELPIRQARLGASQSREIVKDMQALEPEPGPGPGPGPGETLEQHDRTLADYVRQLMLLEQQNKRRLMLGGPEVTPVEALSK